MSILLDGLTYNTRGYFASCVVFFRAPQEIYYSATKGVILIQFYLVRVFFKKMHHLSFRALSNDETSQKASQIN